MSTLTLSARLPLILVALLTISLISCGQPEEDEPVPDTGIADTGSPDTGSPDTGSPDTGDADTGSPDTGDADTGSPDTGPTCGEAETLCGDACVDLQTSNDHCGACGQSCDYACVDGTCDHCASGVHDADEVGVDCGGSCEACVPGTGQMAWRYGGLSTRPHDLMIQSDGTVVVAGRFRNDEDFGGGVISNRELFLAAYDGTGEHLWSKGFGEGAEIGNLAMAAAPDDALVVVGTYEASTIDLGGGARSSAGMSDMFLAKFSATGEHLWSKSFGSESRDVGRAVAVASDGSIAISGAMGDTIDFGGGTISPNPGDDDAFVAVFGADGTHTWSTRLGFQREGNAAGAIAFDSGGNVVLGGRGSTSTSQRERFLMKYDATGTRVWSKQFGSPLSDPWLWAIAIDDNDAVVLVGEATQSVDFGGGTFTPSGADGVVAKFDADGNHQWSKLLGGDRSERANAVAIGPAGDVFVGGYFEGSTDFGGGPLTAAENSRDLFVAKYDSDGAHQWSTGLGGEAESEAVEALGLVDGGLLYATGRFGGTVDFGGTTLQTDTTAGYALAIVP